MNLAVSTSPIKARAPVKCQLQLTRRGDKKELDEKIVLKIQLSSVAVGPATKS